MLTIIWRWSVRPGVGKSWLASALGHKACRDNRSVLYHRVPRLFEALAVARGDGRHPRLLRNLGRADLLILDDWGLEPLDAQKIMSGGGSETGGILFGRYCDLTESFHVVGTLPAPPDSKFSPDEFVLGTEGLRPTLTDLIEGSGGALYHSGPGTTT